MEQLRACGVDFNFGQGVGAYLEAMQWNYVEYAQDVTEMEIKRTELIPGNHTSYEEIVSIIDRSRERVGGT